MPLMGLAGAIDGACKTGPEVHRLFASGCNYMPPSPRGSCLVCRVKRIFKIFSLSQQKMMGGGYTSSELLTIIAQGYSAFAKSKARAYYSCGLTDYWHPDAPPLGAEHSAGSLILPFFTTTSPPSSSLSPSGVIHTHTKGPVGRGRRYEKWHRRWSLR